MLEDYVRETQRWVPDAGGGKRVEKVYIIYDGWRDVMRRGGTQNERSSGLSQSTSSIVCVDRCRAMFTADPTILCVPVDENFCKKC